MKQSIFIVILGLIIAGGCSPKAETSKQNNDIDRYCLALDLKPDSELIKEYRHMHSTKGMWPEIPA